jgi:hypothetical protein
VTHFFGIEQNQKDKKSIFGVFRVSVIPNPLKFRGQKKVARGVFLPSPRPSPESFFDY